MSLAAETPTTEAAVQLSTAEPFPSPQARSTTRRPATCAAIHS